VSTRKNIPKTPSPEERAGAMEQEAEGLVRQALVSADLPGTATALNLFRRVLDPATATEVMAIRQDLTDLGPMAEQLSETARANLHVCREMTGAWLRLKLRGGWTEGSRAAIDSMAEELAAIAGLAVSIHPDLSRGIEVKRGGGTERARGRNARTTKTQVLVTLPGITGGPVRFSRETGRPLPVDAARAEGWEVTWESRRRLEAWSAAARADRVPRELP
jgi:hypothetical protein